MSLLDAEKTPVVCVYLLFYQFLALAVRNALMIALAINVKIAHVDVRLAIGLREQDLFLRSSIKRLNLWLWHRYMHRFSALVIGGA